MKIVAVELTDDAYESLQLEAERTATSIGDIVRQRAGLPRAPKLTPVNLGIPKIPVSEWREVANEGRVP